ncbi:MAG: hypothetical protein QM691_09740 [Opitutaceae bacterium]
MFLFVLLAFGVANLLINARRMSVAALYESSALVVAEGYMEQMKAMPFATLAGSATAASSPAAIQTVNGAGEPDSLTPSTAAAKTTNARSIDVFGHYKQKTLPAGAKDVMPMTFVVTITDLSAGVDDARLLIQLDYTWKLPPALFGGRTRSRSLALIRSNVRAFVN